MISPNEPATLEVVPEESKQIAKIVSDSSLSTETATSLQSSFAPHFEEARKILQESTRISVTDPSQKLQIKLARDFRLALRKVRIAAEKTKSGLKEQALRYNKAVDGFYNIMLHLTSTEEARLEEQEKLVERMETERKAALRLKRVEQLTPFGVNCDFYNLAEMPEDTFATLLDSSRLAHEQKQEQLRRDEQARIDREAAEVKERERVRLENERLKREANEREKALKAEREKVERERLAAEEEQKRKDEEQRKKHEAELAEERRIAREAQEKKDAEARKEREAIEAKAAEDKRIADEKTAAIELQAKRDREAREKVERELQLAKEADERKKKAEAKAKRAAARAPDRDKMLAFAKQVRALQLPELSTEEAKTLLSEITSRIEILAKSIERTADSLNADKE